MASPQEKLVLEHLKKSSLTQLEAIGVYRIYRLAARVKRLRDAGWNIKTKMCRDASGKPYAKYYLGRPHRVEDAFTQQNAPPVEVAA